MDTLMCTTPQCSHSVRKDYVMWCTQKITSNNSLFTSLTQPVLDHCEIVCPHATCPMASPTQDTVALQLTQPLVLLANYTLLQYLMVFYWQRRREPRVALLFFVGVLGVLCLIPFAMADRTTTSALNDVSEACCALAFLIQITIIGRDLNKKIKFKTVLYLTYVAEAIIALDFVVMVFSFVSVADPTWLGDNSPSIWDEIPNACENLTLVFIFFFRFYYIVQSLGWRELHTQRKAEVAWYLLFAFHEVPFIVLEEATGGSWEHAQALWNRLTLAGCLWITATRKLRTKRLDRSSRVSSHVRVSPASGISNGRVKSIHVSHRDVTVTTGRTASIDSAVSISTHRKLDVGRILET